MSKRKELQDSIENSQKAIDASIKNIKAQADHVPNLDERKMELDAIGKDIEAADEDEIEEVHSKMLPLLKADEYKYDWLRDQTAKGTKVLFDSVSSTSGTVSAFVTMRYTVDIMNYSTDSPKALFTFYQDLVDHKARKEELHKRLNQLHPDLGQAFSKVHENAQEAKYDLMTVKQAISDMRDVLNQLWGNLADWALKKCPEKWSGKANKQFDTPAHRQIVAECLIKDPNDRPKFVLLLDNMYGLYTKMSETRIGKNPLNENREQLNDLFTLWITQIDGIVGMLDWEN
jgi:hypothetical protein